LPFGQGNLFFFFDSFGADANEASPSVDQGPSNDLERPSSDSIKPFSYLAKTCHSLPQPGRSRTLPLQVPT
jgi:hypothetical protein